MKHEGDLLAETVSPDPDAASGVVFGKTSARMDEVLQLLRDLGGVSAYGAFSETDALERIATAPRPGALLFGGAMDEFTRERIRADLPRNHAGVRTSEPGKQYPYSDDNIAADIQAKLGMPVIPEF